MINKIKNLFYNDDRPKTKRITQNLCMLLLFLFMMWMLYHSFHYYEEIILITVIDIAVLIFMGLVILAALIVFIRHCLKKNIEYDPLITAAFFGAVNYWVCELVNGDKVIKDYIIFTLTGVFLNILIFILGAAIFRNPRIWFITASVFLNAFCILQYYLIMLRGIPIRLADVFNIKSALAIKSEYSFRLTSDIFFILAVFVITTIWLLSMKFRKSGIAKRTITLAAAVVCAAVVSVTSGKYYNSIYNLGMWFPDKTASTVGSLATIYYDLFNTHIHKSQNYSDEKAIAVLEQYSEEKKDIGTPVILAVLNESWADHKIIYDFSSNKDALPVWRSLDENTIKGYVSVSPFGGNTCNSDYEFLTGNSMLFLPDGVGVYSMYIDSHKDSIVDTFNNYGFDTIGISPISKNVWNIEEVYEHYGFDRTYFLDGDIPLEESKKSDSQFYREICKLADERDKSKGLFIMASTMQDHTPYNEYKSDEIRLEYPYDKSAEIYLNSVHLSDQATLELIDHFRDYDEKVIIVMFGDHFPDLIDFDNALFDERPGLSEMEKNSLTHRTPFFIWCNQDIDEEEIGEISLNYLSNEVMKAADIPLTPMQQELEHIKADIPVITGWGYKGRNGKWYSKAEMDSEYQDIISEYSEVCYYRLLKQYN